MRWGKRESIPRTLHYHHQNDSCIQMGSNESRFNVSLTVSDKVIKTVSTNHNPFEERRAEAESSRGPSAYQPNVLPLGQTGSEGKSIKAVDIIRSGCRPTINLIVCFCTLKSKKAPRK